MMIIILIIMIIIAMIIIKVKIIITIIMTIITRTNDPDFLCWHFSTKIAMLLKILF